jgi:hypothetical protein
MTSSNHTFSFSNFTFGNYPNYNAYSHQLSNTLPSSKISNQANIVDIVPENNQNEIFEIIEPKIEPQENLANYGDQNLPYQQKINDTITSIQEPDYKNNIIYGTQTEIYKSQQEFQDFQPQFQFHAQIPMLTYQKIQDIQPQISNQIITSDLHPHNQSSDNSQNQQNYEDLFQKSQNQSQYKKIINGLRPFNEYQTLINESQSEQYYQSQAHENYNINQLPPNKLDKLIDHLNEQILKQNELNEWFKKAVDEQMKVTEEIKKFNEEQKKLNEEMKKLNEKIFQWMRYIENKNSGSS